MSTRPQLCLSFRPGRRRVDAAAVDAGLRAYMLRIYNYMSIGLASPASPRSASIWRGDHRSLRRRGQDRQRLPDAFGYAMFVSP